MVNLGELTDSKVLETTPKDDYTRAKPGTKSFFERFVKFPAIFGETSGVS